MRNKLYSYSQIKQIGNYFFTNSRKSKEDGNDSVNNIVLTMQRFVQFNSVFNAVNNILQSCMAINNISSKTKFGKVAIRSYNSVFV